MSHPIRSAARRGSVVPLAVLALLAPLTLFGAACARGGAGDVDPVHDAALRDTLTALVTDAYDFTRSDAAARLMTLYPTDGPVISASAGRVSVTRAALEQSITRFWQRVGQNMVGPKFVVGQRFLTTLGPDAAVLTMTYSIPHHTPEGLPHTIGGAWTAVFARRGGRWTIVQEHLSDPPPQPAAAAMPDSMQMP